MNDSKYIVPMEGYRDPQGCLHTMIATIVGIILTVILCLCFPSCKTQTVIPQTKDSVRIEYRHDSIYFYQHDSIFRDRWRAGDTVYVTVEKWLTRWKDKTVEIHDTILTQETQTIEVKYVPNYYKRVSTGFWILLAILIVIVGWKIAKIYFKIQSGGIL